MLTLPLNSGTVREVETTIGGNSYQFTTKWNSRFESYTLDIVMNGEDLVYGIKLVYGVDIFEAFTELPLKRGYVINKLGANEKLQFDGLDISNGFLILIEDSDLEE